ncbi:hypothetical protein J6590_097560, partial [Homalodisca vitripennis]
FAPQSHVWGVKLFASVACYTCSLGNAKRTAIFGSWTVTLVISQLWQLSKTDINETEQLLYYKQNELGLGPTGFQSSNVQLKPVGF